MKRNQGHIIYIYNDVKYVKKKKKKSIERLKMCRNVNSSHYSPFKILLKICLFKK